MSGGGQVSLNEDYIRVVMFMIIGTVVAYLSERIAKTEKTLSDSEEKFRGVFNQVNDIITLIELKEDGQAGNYVEVNDVALKTLGYSLDEFLQMTPADIGKKGEFTRDKVNTLLNEGKVTFERTYITKDGHEIPVEVNSHIFTFKGKKMALSVARDISERKKAEEELKSSKKRFEILFEYAPDAYYLNDIKGNFVDGNKAAEKLTGFSKEELIGKNLLELKLLAGEELSRAAKMLEKSVQGISMGPAEFIFYNKSGKEINVEIIVSPVEIEGQKLFLVLARDITDRKHAEESFKKISYQNKLVLDSVGEGIYGVDKTGIITFFNSFAEKTTGFSLDEAIGKNSHDLMHHTKSDGTPFPLEECTVHNLSLLKGESKMVTNELFWRKDGSSFPVEYITTPIIESGEIQGAVVIFHDISDRIEMESALKDSEERFREVFNEVNDIITLIELEKDGRAGNYIEVNDVALKTLGYSLDEFLQMTPADIGKKGEVTRDKVNTLLNEGKVTFERTYITKDGHEVPVEINSHIFTFKGKKVALSVARDISERKKAEDQTRIEHQKLLDIIEFLPDATFVIDNDKKVIAWNKAIEDMTGVSKDKIMGKGNYEYSLPFYGYRRPILIDLIFSDATEVELKYDYIKRKEDTLYTEIFVNNLFDGKGAYLFGKASPLYDGKWNIIGAIETIRDISENKKAEDALKESEEKFRELFNSANDMISLNYMEKDGSPGKFIEINDAGCERLDYTKDEFLNMTPKDIVAPEKLAEMPQNAEKLRKKGYAEYEMVHLTKDGRKIPVEVNNHLFKFKEKTVALAISRDITDRKEAEKVIIASENRYRTLFEISPEYIVLLSAEGMVLDINNTVQELTGFKKDEIIGMPFMELDTTYKDDVSFYNQLIVDLMSGKEVDPFETKMIDKEGKTHILKVYAKKFKLEDHEGILTVADDITTIKEVENELKLSLKEKEMLLKEIHHRVKNNLMVISSLLNLQSQYIKDKEALGIFKESQSRAKSMALIHERLYRSTDLKRIDFGEYIRTLTTDLFRTYVPDASLIKLIMDVENIMLDINTSVPLGLIVNELVSNSMKHAFPDKMKGEIEVDFKLQGDNFMLSVADNGVGFPENIDFKNTDSLGLQLVNSLVSQIDGEINLDKENGSKFTVLFKEYKNK
ncbi:MAG: PAS domain S-box protein [Methanobacterium sp.]|uniref:PAS domain S-box protein n=1 Tax=Methanobacterium sp. TaxID=2164 RepID=UPI003D64F234|nr:PAS domain S-box protein [Methanobacterium sp.]